MNCENTNILKQACKNIISCVDPNAERSGVAETPLRMAKAWKELTRGYAENPEELLKVFEDGAENYNEMVVVKDIPLYSLCEHHALPFFGRATVAYIPNGKIVGLSKIPRVVNTFSRRLQTQERITTQVADLLFQHLQPLGVGVMIRARHMCMEARGVCQQGHATTTCALRGVLAAGDPRAEFLALAQSDAAI